MQSPSDTHMTTPGSVSHEAEREPSGCGLGANVDVLVCRAEWYYHVGAYQVRACLTTAQEVHEGNADYNRVTKVLLTLWRSGSSIGCSHSLGTIGEPSCTVCTLNL